jgi:hypothetical protein
MKRAGRAISFRDRDGTSLPARSNIEIERLSR